MTTGTAGTFSEKRVRGRRNAWWIAALVAISGVACGNGADDVDGQGGTGTEGTASEGIEAEAAPPGSTDLAIVFTGADGSDGCRYEGPFTLVAGTWTSTLANDSDYDVYANLDPLAEGKDYEDWLAAHEPVSDSAFPVVHKEPKDSSWRGESPKADSSWNQIHPSVTAGTSGPPQQIDIPPGRYLLSCWTFRGGEGLAIWSPGVVTATEPE